MGNVHKDFVFLYFTLFSTQKLHRGGRVEFNYNLNTALY